MSYMVIYRFLYLPVNFLWETMRSRYNQSTPMFWFCCNRNFASLLYILQQPFQASAISGDVFRISLCFKVLPFLTGCHWLNKGTGTRDNEKECGLSWIPWPVSISLGCWLTSNITPQNTDPYRGSSSLFQWAGMSESWDVAHSELCMKIILALVLFPSVKWPAGITCAKFRLLSCAKWHRTTQVKLKQQHWKKVTLLQSTFL